jgi:hypothetical protein
MITPSTDIIVIPPQEQKTANAFWINSLNIYSPQVGGEATVNVSLIPYNSQTGESFPVNPIQFTIDSVLSKCADQPDLANCIQVIFAEVDRQAKLAGVI